MNNTQKQYGRAHDQYCPITLANAGRWFSTANPVCTCGPEPKTYTQSEVDVLLAIREAEMVEKVNSMKKTGNDGEGLPFENSPEIYGNKRVEAYKQGYNASISDTLLALSKKD